MNAKNPVRGVIFLYVSSFAEMGLAFLFLFIIARTSPPGVVGVASTALSITSMTISVSNLGIARGLSRFLGKSEGQRDYRQFQSYLNSALFLLSISTIVGSVSILILSGLLQTSYGFSLNIILTISLIVLFANIVPPFQSALVSMMKTNYHSAISIASGVMKITVGTLLIFLGLGSTGILLGVLVMYVTSLLLNWAATWHLLRKTGVGVSFRGATKNHEVEVLKAGIPTYVPGTIQHLGTKLGVLIVFGAAGASDTAFYYIALQIWGVVTVIPTVIMNLLLPYVSGHRARDCETLQQGMKFSLVFAMPVIASLLLYPSLPLGIVGNAYIAASVALQLLLVSIPFIAVSSGISTLAYARGEYKLVLGIGLSANLPRVVLYIMLTPLLGGNGAALAFLIGSVVGLPASYIAARKMKFSVNKRMLILAAIPSLMLSALVGFLGIAWYLGIPVILLVSILAVAKLGVVSRGELVEIGHMMLPSTILDRYKTRLSWALKMIYGP